jgi:two-component system NtrC family sensor kinase
MEQVLLNLVQNAARSLQRQGRPGTISVSAFQRAGMILVEVADDGPGVPPEIRDKIFEPFFSTRGREGTGLGLSIASGIVQEHGGKLELMPDRGPGATFRVSLPMRFSPGARPPRPEPDIALEHEASRTLLLVTDDAPLRRQLERTLRSVGYRTDAVPDGLAAANLLRDPSRYRLVLADLKGAAPNGAALAERFGMDVPFVLMTDDGELARRYDTGGRGRPWPVLRHPCEPKDVLAVTERLLERADRTRETARTPTRAAKA